MNLRKVIQRRIRVREGGVDLQGDVNAQISANVGRTRSAPTAAKPTEKKEPR